MMFRQTLMLLPFLLVFVSAKVVRECKTDCDSDADCAPGLLCADSHEKELAKSGHDKQKAYCGPVGASNLDVCYDPTKLSTKPKIIVPYTPPSPRIALCKADCDLDIDCAPGLWCADEHTKELEAAGYHPRFADCPDSAKRGVKAYFEVCFDPKIIKKTGGGGGDPHFKTYDGTKYSYHGECDLVMARSSTFGAGSGLDLHIRTKIVTDWSLISNAALRIGDDVFEVANDGSYYFNGAKDVELPIELDGKHTVTKFEDTVFNSTRTHFTIELDNYDDSKIAMNVFKGMIAVRVDALLEGTGGVLGMHGKEGMIGRDRETVMSDANSMGAEWQVRDNEPMLFHEIRAPQYPAQCKLPSTSVSQRRSRRLRDQDNSFAEEACANVSEDMFDFCVQDVILTGDASLAHGFGYAF